MRSGSLPLWPDLHPHYRQRLKNGCHWNSLLEARSFPLFFAPSYIPDPRALTENISESIFPDKRSKTEAHQHPRRLTPPSQCQGTSYLASPKLKAPGNAAPPQVVTKTDPWVVSSHPSSATS